MQHVRFEVIHEIPQWKQVARFDSIVSAAWHHLRLPDVLDYEDPALGIWWETDRKISPTTRAWMPGPWRTVFRALARCGALPYQNVRMLDSALKPTVTEPRLVVTIERKGR